jgi:UDP-N-acetylmuramoyl-L-alanyl-D-glutamate--2,6-diaminopimelate ligase
MNVTTPPANAERRAPIVDNVRDLVEALNRLPTTLRGATASSRDSRQGMAFLAYPGAIRDGRDFIGDAVLRGASAVLYEADDFAWKDEWRVPRIAVRGLKQFASAIGGHIYAHPSNALWMVGITGTNGKTSVSQWVAQALNASGKTAAAAAVLGTIGNGLVSGALQPSDNTTPDALALQRLLREFTDAGATACAMEVSSHGLDQGRVADVKYDVAVFTNLTRDHLDYHGTMETYGEAKAKLFTMRGLNAAVVNVDDVFGREIASRLEKNAERRGVKVIRYAMNGGAKFANLIATDISISSAGLSFTVRGQHDLSVSGEALVESHILGAFNVSNLLAVIGVLLVSGVSLADAAARIASLDSVPGRMQTIREPKRPLVVVDYAHTPDALEKALSTLAAIVPDKGRLISVFGCGGDRDRGKRPQMGAISAKYADFTVVTSDNPRNEDLIRIIDDIEMGVGSAPHDTIADRHQAIFEALNHANANDVVLIAGKGHEDYQIIGEAKHHFSDVEVAREALAAWTGGAR